MLGSMIGMSVDDQEFQDEVFRMVMWGERRQDVLDFMSSRGVSGRLAHSIYEENWRHRIRVIRMEKAKKLFIGVPLLAAGIGLLLFALYKSPSGPVSKGLSLVGATSLVFGAWKTLDGLAGTIAPQTYRGSVADEI